MTNTLQIALTPLLNIGSFCGLGLLEYPLGHPRPYISCLFIFAVWSFFTYSVYYPTYFFIITERHMTPLAIMVIATNIIISITIVISILISFFYFKEFKMCLYELSLVDDTIEAIGAPKKYQRLRKWIIRIIIGWIVYIFYISAGNIYDLFLSEFYSEVNLVVIYKKLVLTYPSYVHILSTLIWGTIFEYTSSRFQQVNDRLHVLYFDLFENNADYRRQNRSILVCQRITETESCKQYIWIIM
ncbi:hypothetical protein ALC53_09163 [Atta colombica]|uniref:Gustatory receptor n=1 Tax=Atta colombica TaxID=520822 RepID=A0A151I1K1_9HYME|nr:hypothetical protein ALC53_09163 [Atta colombica]